MRRIEATVALAACACLCAALGGCTAKEPAAQEAVSSPQAASELHSDLKEAEPAEAPLHEGKDEVTVLVLNACGVEGAAKEAAEKVRDVGFKNVTVGNAMYFNQGSFRVSYHHKEHWAEVQEVMELFDANAPEGMYCYDQTPSAGGWGKEYDILVMVGDPSAEGNSVSLPHEPVSLAAGDFCALGGKVAQPLLGGTRSKNPS